MACNRSYNRESRGHCLAHVLNLVLQDISEKVEMCRDILGIISELINFVTCSPKSLDLFHAFQREGKGINLQKVCPTRWTFRTSSLPSVVENYRQLIMFLRDIRRTERR